MSLEEQVIQTAIRWCTAHSSEALDELEDAVNALLEARTRAYGAASIYAQVLTGEPVLPWMPRSWDTEEREQSDDS